MSFCCSSALTVQSSSPIELIGVGSDSLGCGIFVLPPATASSTFMEPSCEPFEVEDDHNRGVILLVNVLEAASQHTKAAASCVGILLLQSW